MGTAAHLRGSVSREDFGPADDEPRAYLVAAGAPEAIAVLHEAPRSAGPGCASVPAHPRLAGQWARLCSGSALPRMDVDLEL